MRLQNYTDLIIAFYLMLTAGLVLAYRQQVEAWEYFVLAHLAIAGLILLFQFAPERLPGPLQLIRDWYPVPLFLLFWSQRIYTKH